MMRRRVPTTKGSSGPTIAKSGTIDATDTLPIPADSDLLSISEKVAAAGTRLKMDGLSGAAAQPLVPSTAATTRERSYGGTTSLDGHVDDTSAMAKTMSRRTQWLVFAVASGACAAFNGVFAKLTTTELTTSIARNVSMFLHLGDGNWVVEYLIRAMFFGLNLVFNGIMWYLFTKALTLHTSTTQVSIINTSSNFMLTAFLGLLIFSESLPPLWWVGAAMLVAGNVIIGRRTEVEDKGAGGRDVDGSRDEGLEDGLLNGVEFDSVAEPFDMPELDDDEEKYLRPREDDLIIKNGSGSVPR